MCREVASQKEALFDNKGNLNEFPKLKVVGKDLLEFEIKDALKLKRSKIKLVDLEEKNEEETKDVVLMKD